MDMVLMVEANGVYEKEWEEAIALYGYDGVWSLGLLFLFHFFHIPLPTLISCI